MKGDASPSQMDSAKANLPSANRVRLVQTSSTAQATLMFIHSAEISTPGRAAAQINKPVAGVTISKETAAVVVDLLQQWLLQ